MSNEDLVKEIIEIVTKIAKMDTFQSTRKECLIDVRNKILEYQKEDNGLLAITIYLNGLIRGIGLR